MFFALLYGLDDPTTEEVLLEEVLLSGEQHRALLSGAAPLATLALDLEELAISAEHVHAVDVQTGAEGGAKVYLGGELRRVFARAA